MIRDKFWRKYNLKRITIEHWKIDDYSQTFPDKSVILALDNP